MRQLLASASALGIALVILSCRVQDQPTRAAEKETGSVTAPATLPPFFRETVVARLNDPTAMAMAPDGRLFVCQQSGALRIVKNDTLLPSPFLTVPALSGGERGLLGVALDPDYANQPYVYVYYTVASPVHNRISRFRASGANPDSAIEGETVLLELDDLGAQNHNGGALQFGSDGMLYAAVGDNAVGANSQSMANLLGKIIRIGKDGVIPSDNPFYATATGRNRAIWALGLRNPYTFSIQGGTGRMYINDVGEHDWEEINEGASGANYGWPATEGVTANPAFKSPVYSYANGIWYGKGPECAISGSAFYTPESNNFPAEYAGDYFFGDYCAGWIKVMDAPGAAPRDFASGIPQFTGMIVGRDGALYYSSIGLYSVVKVTYAASSAPHISLEPKPATVNEGRPAGFTVSATGAAPLAYRWKRDTADIPGASAATYSIAATAKSDSGATFRCIVSNAHGSDTSVAAVLHVLVNKGPSAEITLPDTALRFRAGDSLRFAGTGTDPEDGTLAASAFSWKIEFHHDTHSHPFLPATAGIKSGAAAIPVVGEVSSNVWLRVHLTVTDSKGTTHSIYRDAHPRKTVITLATQPPGLELVLDGQPIKTPHEFTGVAGMRRPLDARAQTSGGKSWAFKEWSDGGLGGHAVTVPDTAQRYLATFSEVPVPVGIRPGNVR